MGIECLAIFKFGPFLVGIRTGSQLCEGIEAIASHYGGSVERVWRGNPGAAGVCANAEQQWPSLDSESFESDLVLALLRQGVTLVHGAALSHGGRNILVLGESGAGKSTLTFFGLKSGWKIVSDDTLLAWIDLDGVVRLRYFRNDVLLRQSVGVDLISDLAVPMELVKVGEETRWLLSRVPIQDAFLDSLAPNCIWISEVDHQREQSEAVKASHADAFAALVRGTSPLYMTPDYPNERAVLLPIITALAQGCPTYKLSLGQNLLTHPEAEMQRLLEITS